MAMAFAAPNINGVAVFKVDFLDVGQGDSTLIRLYDKEDPLTAKLLYTMLIDFGTSAYHRKGHVAAHDALTFLTVTEPLTRINMLVITHSDGDHYNMIGKMLDKLPDLDVDAVLHSGLENQYGGIVTKLKGWEGKSRTKPLMLNVPQTTDGTAPVSLLSGSATAHVLAHEVGRPLPNSMSTVVLMTYDNRKYLFMGDATDETETYLMNHRAALIANVDVLKVGHHGSYRSSNSYRFLKVVNPRSAFVSSDRHGVRGTEPGISGAQGYALPQLIVYRLLEKVMTDGGVDRLVFRDVRHEVIFCRCAPTVTGGKEEESIDDDKAIAGVSPLVTEGTAANQIWLNFSTSLPIFTSLRLMDVAFPAWGIVADLGCHYQINAAVRGNQITLASAPSEDDFRTKYAPVALFLTAQI